MAGIRTETGDGGKPELAEKRRQSRWKTSFASNPPGANPRRVMQKLSKVLLGLTETVLAQPVAKTICEGSAAALLLAHVAWNRAVAPLTADHLGLYRQGLAALAGENPDCLKELKSADCEVMVGELMALKRHLYPADDRIIYSCALTPKGTVRVEWHEQDERSAN